MSEWLKLPGLFHRYELEQVIDADGHHEYLFEQAGQDAQGRELIAVYCKRHDVAQSAGMSVTRRIAPANANCVGGAQ